MHAFPSTTTIVSQPKMRDEIKEMQRQAWIFLGFLSAAFAPIDGLFAQTAIAGHLATFDTKGHLIPWISLETAIDREMQFYEAAPRDHGYPIFVTTTFLDGTWKPLAERDDNIPATQNGMGIISYLKFYAWRGKRDPRILDIAKSMGDYLIVEDLTPNVGAYPRFTRSTGKRTQFPQSKDAGSQSDRPYEIEPDKGGIAGYALMLLYRQTSERKYLAQALHNARLLAKHQRSGDALRSPWPFRVDYRTGQPRGEVSSNMTYILQLYDELIALGYHEFDSHRTALWAWIVGYQIPSARSDGNLFAQFFEDHDNPANRNAWAPLNLARYILEKSDRADPKWKEQATLLIDFVRKNFTHRENGILVCHEQDEDHDAWGGINSSYAAVLAMFAKATRDETLAAEARDALIFTAYSINENGQPRDLAKHEPQGGWQEDAHTDVIHNFVDALRAYPAWAR
jgi:hypothetical protein